MHDPKMDVVRENPWGRRYGLALAYQTDAAPARHTGPQSINLEQKASSAAGLCSVGGGAYREGRFCEVLSAVTGVPYTARSGSIHSRNFIPAPCAASLTGLSPWG